MENSREEEKITNTTRLTLETRHQLIDLNKEYVNFEIFFECKSCDASKDFDMLVINQDQLDSIDLANLAMKRTRGGYISGTIVADEDKYQNYFLVIRATEENAPTDVDLTISIKPIAPNKDKLRPTQEPVHNSSPNVQMPTTHPCLESSSKSSMQLYMILGALVVAGVIVYFLWKKRKAGENTNDLALETMSNAGSEVSSTTSSKGVLKELILNRKGT